MDYSQEIRQLEAEGEIPLIDLIASLPSMPSEPEEGEQERKEEEGEGGEGKEEGEGGEGKEEIPRERRAEKEDTPTRRKTRLAILQPVEHSIYLCTCTE